MVRVPAGSGCGCVQRNRALEAESLRRTGANAVGCVLLIACSNIASLLAARGASRRKEFSIRTALGATRGRLIWQLASENLLLSLAGGAGGLLLAYGGLGLLRALLPADLPRADGIGINGIVLAFTFSVCVLTGLVFGLLPASQIVPKPSSAGPQVNRTRGFLVALQFALAIVLLTGAGLLIRSFLLLNAVQPGFDTTRLLTVDVNLSERLLNEAIQQIESLPGVSGVAVGDSVFGSFRGHVPNQNIVVEGRPPTQDIERHARNVASADYFRVMGIPLREGRLFTTQDEAGKPGVAIINQTMARHFWPAG